MTKLVVRKQERLALRHLKKTDEMIHARSRGASLEATARAMKITAETLSQLLKDDPRAREVYEEAYQQYVLNTYASVHMSNEQRLEAMLEYQARGLPAKLVTDAIQQNQEAVAEWAKSVHPVLRAMSGPIGPQMSVSVVNNSEHKDSVETIIDAPPGPETEAEWSREWGKE